jgi:NRAMP (natural resistance-associated macrophage protein)-like metal ion transporter
MGVVAASACGSGAYKVKRQESTPEALRRPLVRRLHAAPTSFNVIRYRMLALLAVVGPGFITANVDNDPGGILTYSQAGAKYGYTLLWTLIPTTIALIVVQEMAARMGAITGKGLSDLIREEFGLRMTFFTMIVLGLADFGNIAAEFAGLASGMGIFGISKYVAVPIGAALVWVVIVRGSYKPVERILLILSMIYFAYPISAVLAHPDWKMAVHDTIVPQFNSDPGYLVMIVGLIGTTITPWMQFYLQSSIVEKGITAREYRASRWDVIVGCLFTDIVAWFIVVACAATLYAHGVRQIRDAADAAQALRPLSNEFAYILFAAGLFNASLFAASILPISTAYTVCEGLGFESGVDKKFDEAKVFYWLYTLLLIAGGAVILMPNIPLVKITILSQVVNGIVLPFVLIFMLLLVNKSELMGKHVNGTWFNVIAWATTIIMIGLTIAWFVTGGGS